jgi:hypothetical protein
VERGVRGGGAHAAAAHAAGLPAGGAQRVAAGVPLRGRAVPDRAGAGVHLRGAAAPVLDVGDRESMRPVTIERGWPRCSTLNSIDEPEI